MKIVASYQSISPENRQWISVVVVKHQTDSAMLLLGKSPEGYWSALDWNDHMVFISESYLDPVQALEALLGEFTNRLVVGDLTAIIMALVPVTE